MRTSALECYELESLIRSQSRKNLSGQGQAVEADDQAA